MGPRDASGDFYERVQTACVTETSRRDTHTADQPTVVRYCRCTQGIARDEFTPAEFDVFGRYGIAQTSDEPAPAQEEMRALETPEFAERVRTLQTRVAAECNSILWPAH